LIVVLWQLTPSGGVAAAFADDAPAEEGDPSEEGRAELICTEGGLNIEPLPLDDTDDATA
jgi:hypothetical protein